MSFTHCHCVMLSHSRPEIVATLMTVNSIGHTYRDMLVAIENQSHLAGVNKI